MSALGTVIRAGVGRRRVQTAVMTLTTMMTVAASVLAAGLLVASRAPFDHAFAAQKGAHLTAQFDGAKVTAAGLAGTAHASGVTAAAGPFPVVSLRPHVRETTLPFALGGRLPAMTVAGRADPGGPVDRLVLTAGHWATGRGQIVLNTDGPPFGPGDRLDLPDLPGDPVLTVVGQARSVGESADSWVTPAQAAALTPPGGRAAYQMLYRFTDAATDARVTADRAAIAAAVPPGSMTGAASYLKVRLAATRTAAAFVPFVTAFGVLGLVMSVLIIGIVVSGAVTAATWRIGVLKSVGFTPAQIARAYVAQALVPAAVGAALGVALGDLLAVPVLRQAESAYGTGQLTVASWIDVAVPAAALTAVAATALVPALRAGRLRTAEAIAVGRTPRAGHGRPLQHILGRLPLPRPVALGLAAAVARPARSATTGVAVTLGTIGVTFGLGLALSLSGIQDGLNRRTPGAVVVQAAGPPAPGLTRPAEAADPKAIAAAIAARPGTRRYFSTGDAQVGVAGIAGGTTVIAYSGDSSWGSYQMVSGSWFHGPGQAVVPSGFLKATGTHIGDTVTLTGNGREAPVRIVGEALDLRNEGMTVLTDASSLAGLGATVVPESVRFDIDLVPGTDRQAYLNALATALRPLGATAEAGSGELSGVVVAMDTLAATLAVLLVAVAGLGVLNTVVLDTRERVHDLGVLKALGMAPGQTVTMVLSSVAVIGLLAGVLGVPIGIALHDLVLPAIGRAAGTRFPAADITVYGAATLAGLVAGGPLIATAGAFLPAGWAAKTRVATALRTE